MSLPAVTDGISGFLYNVSLIHHDAEEANKMKFALAGIQVEGSEPTAKVVKLLRI